MLDEWKERWRKPLIDESFWIWTVQPVPSMASKKPLPTTAISDALVTIPCFASTSSEIAKIPCFGPATFTVRMAGKELLEPIVARYEKKKFRKYFRGDAAFPSRGFMNTWRRRAFCMPSGFPQTMSFRRRLNTC